MPANELFRVTPGRGGVNVEEMDRLKEVLIEEGGYAVSTTGNTMEVWRIEHHHPDPRGGDGGGTWD